MREVHTFFIKCCIHLLGANSSLSLEHHTEGSKRSCFYRDCTNSAQNVGTQLVCCPCIPTTNFQKICTACNQELRSIHKQACLSLYASLSLHWIPNHYYPDDGQELGGCETKISTVGNSLHLTCISMNIVDCLYRSTYSKIYHAPSKFRDMVI